MLTAEEHERLLEWAIEYNIEDQIQNIFDGYRILFVPSRKLQRLPPELYKLEHLEHMEVSHNQLTEIPAGITQLKNLRYLNVSYNQLVQLPTEISQLKNLKQLHVDHNQLTELPPQIGELESLKKLTVLQQDHQLQLKNFMGASKR